MKHRIPRLLTGSIVFVIVLCVIVFTTQTVRMNRKSAKPINVQELMRQLRKCMQKEEKI